MTAIGRADAARLTGLLDVATGANPDPSLADTLAVVVVHGEQIVAERYANDATATTPLISWSMAKSITHALIGILVGDGVLDVGARAEVAEWADPDDPRHAITLEQLLAMVDGLAFNETYALPETDDAAVPTSHVIEMLFGAGSADTAAYAAARPAAHRPGSHFNYSSGTTNIICRLIGDHVGRGSAAEEWMRARLFEPIGMTSADPRFDDAGTFVGSSYLYATARDFARFGLLYLRDGVWEGERILPPGWVDAARTLRSVDRETGRGYGLHWWVDDDGRGTFRASGYEGQRIMVVPANDLVVVRLGKSPGDDQDPVTAWTREVIECFDP